MGEINQIDVLLMVVSILDRLGIEYVVGGSFASSARGIPRATMDIDIVADLNDDNARSLVQAVQPDFYADESAILRSVRIKRHFNIIHIDTAFKVDVFVPRNKFDRAQLARRVAEPFGPDQGSTVYVASAEDIVLAKLRWYLETSRTSERQWRDVLGVLQVQAGRLDLSYLKEWALELGLSEELDRALLEAGA
jgi:hypothetical protein